MFSLGDSGREAIGRYLTPFVYVSAGMTLLVGIFAEEVLTLVTPSSYHGAIPVASILALRYGILFFGKQPQLVFARKTYLLSLLTIVNLGLNVGLNVLLIPLWGATGAAWGSLAVGVISGSLYFAIGQHYYRIRWEYRKLTAIFGLLGVSILLMVISTGFGVAYGVRLFGKVVFVAAFLGLGVRIGFLTREQYGLARGMLRSIFRSQHSGVGA
jgi:O-antigen/teichoic acid export membrane protein